MFLRRVLPIIVILAAGLVGTWQYQHPCDESIDSAVQYGWKDSFEIKIERIPERCGFGAAVAGANYVFSSRQIGSNSWYEIMEFRHDDPIDLSIENILIVNDKVAFVFMVQKAAGTSDAGKTWNLWNAQKDIVNWKGDNYGLIERVEMSDSGEGTMFMHTMPDRNEPNELYTSDFGKTWELSK